MTLSAEPQRASKARDADQSRVFDNAIDKFRAIAIVFVVASHCYGLAGVTFDTFADRFIENLITGATVFFVFISGFLFHHVFYPTFVYTRFLHNKAKRLLLPYTVLTIPFALKFIFLNASAAHGTAWVSGAMLTALRYYIFGWPLTTYWYLPFIASMFLLSPLHRRFIEFRLSTQLAITAGFFVIAVFLHRPTNPLFVWQSVVFFTPVYLMGIHCSIHRDAVVSTISGREIYLAAAAVALALLEAALGHHGNYGKNPFDYNGIDLVLIQKSLAAIALFVWLRRFDATHSKYWTLLAATSFSVFFFNPYMVGALTRLELYFAIAPAAAWAWAVYCLLVPAILATSVFVAVLVKKAAPKYSRALIGY